jgi:hypothetical protein
MLTAVPTKVHEYNCPRLLPLFVYDSGFPLESSHPNWNLLAVLKGKIAII